MPVGAYDKGDLYVQFDVQFPKTKMLEKGQVESQLSRIQPKEQVTTTAKEEKILEDAEGPIPENEYEERHSSKYSRKKSR